MERRLAEFRQSRSLPDRQPLLRAATVWRAPALLAMEATKVSKNLRKNLMVALTVAIVAYAAPIAAGKDEATTASGGTDVETPGGEGQTYDNFDEEPYMAPNESAPDPSARNFLDIDGLTGLPSTWENGGHARTDIRIFNLEPGVPNLHLRAPTGHYVFMNTSTGLGGDLHFPNLKIQRGLYAVTQGPLNGTNMLPEHETVLVQFVAPGEILPPILSFGLPWLPFWNLPLPHDRSLPIMFAGRCAQGAAYKADGTPCPQSSGGSSGGGECQGWYGDVRTATATLWTSMLLVNSPYAGSTTAGTAWSNARSVYMIWGHSSTTSWGPKISTSNGQSKGMFQLVTWGSYDKYYYGCGGPYKTGSYSTIDNWRPNGVDEFKGTDSNPIYGLKRETDADDRTTIAMTSPQTGNTHNSVAFDARYRTRDGIVASAGTLQVQSQTFYSIGGGVSVGGTFFSFDYARASANAGGSSYFTYNFPSGTTYMDYLGSATDSTKARAFCRAVNGVACA